MGALTEGDIDMHCDMQELDCRRTEPRSALRHAALAFRSDGRRSVVTVSDMSLGGLQIEGASFANDDEFRLVIPRRGDMNARIRWTSASSAGAQFDEDLLLNDVVPARESYALRRLRSFNFSSGRVFGRRGLPAE